MLVTWNNLTDETPHGILLTDDPQDFIKLDDKQNVQEDKEQPATKLGPT